MTRFNSHFLWLPIALALCSSCSQDPAIAFSKAFGSGNKYFEEKQYGKAIVEYRKALQLDPRSGQARYRLARAYDQLGDGPNAATEYVRAADLLPNDADAQVRAGVFLLARRSFEDAKARATNALRVDPRHVEAHMLLAEATAMMSDVDGATREIEKTIQMEPGEPRVYARLGRYQVAQGDPEKAERSFKRAVELAPESLDAVLALAKFYLSTTGRSTDAEHWLKRAVEIAPHDPQVNRTLAALYISANRAPEAERPLKEYADASPSAVGRLTLADYYFAQNRPQDARKLLEPFQNDKDFAGAVLTRLAVIEASEGHQDQAYKLLDQAIARNPGDVDALVMRGRLLTAQRRYVEAASSLQTAVEANPKSALAHYFYGVNSVDAGDVDLATREFTEALKLEPTETGSKLQLALIALRQGKGEIARNLAAEAVRAQPQNGQARLVWIDALIATGDLQTAEKQASFVAANAPNLSEPHVQLGRIALAQHDYVAAERSFDRAMQLANGNLTALSGVVDARIGRGRFADAHTVVDDYIRRDPRRPELYLYSARIYRAEHDAADSEAALRRALVTDPQNDQAASELAQLYMAQQKYDEARKQLDAIVARQPKAIWAHTLIGMSFERQNRRSEARERYQKILEIDPHSAMAANNLAMLYLTEGQNLDVALQYAQTAKAAMPNAPQIDDTLGLIYMKKNLSDLAIAALKDAVARDGMSAEYSYHLGLAYLQNKDGARSREMFEKALRLSPTFEGADDARARLRSANTTASRAGA